MVNQFFRRDIFCRGPRGNFNRDLDEIAQTRIHLVAPPPPNDNLELKVVFGEMTLQPAAFAGIVEALHTGPKSIAELGALPDTRGQGIEVTLRILLLLLHSRILAVGAAGAANPEVAKRLNSIIANRASAGFPYDHIASSAIGSAIPVSHAELTLLNAWLTSSDRADAQSLARKTAADLALARTFLEQKLPAWRMLGALT